VDILIIYIANRDPQKTKQAKLIHSLPGKQSGDTMLY